MKTLVCLLATLLLTISAPLAANTEPNLRTYASRAGLPESVGIEEIDMGGPNAYYTKGGTMCIFWVCALVPEHIGLSLPADWPFEFKLAILLHEVGHWAYGHPASSMLTEWEADDWAVAELCEFGFNGPEIMAGTLIATYGHQMPEDSDTHGSPWERIHRLRAQRCGSHEERHEA